MLGDSQFQIPPWVQPAINTAEDAIAFFVPAIPIGQGVYEASQGDPSGALQSVIPGIGIVRSGANLAKDTVGAAAAETAKSYLTALALVGLGVVVVLLLVYRK